MTEEHPQSLTRRLQGELRDARAGGDRVAAGVLRTTLAAIENAQVVEVDLSTSTPSETVAGAVVGLGAAEAPRRALTDDEILAVIDGEIRERTEAAALYVGAGRTAEAARLQAEVAVLERLRR